jgi:hypothetical protein
MNLRAALAAPFRPLARLDWSDLWTLAGFAGATYGIQQVSEPAAWIVSGSLLLLYGLTLGGVIGIGRGSAGTGTGRAGNPR